MLGSSSPSKTAALEALTKSAGISTHDWGMMGLKACLLRTPSTSTGRKAWKEMYAIHEGRFGPGPRAPQVGLFPSEVVLQRSS
eukprot:9797065-Heterocapsa_arctica.AAC.1